MPRNKGEEKEGERKMERRGQMNGWEERKRKGRKREGYKG